MQGKTPRELMAAEDRIIVALDVNTVDRALALFEDLEPHVGLFKIGPALAKAMLKSLVKPKSLLEAQQSFFKIRNLYERLERRNTLMSDDKFNDITKTVADAVHEVAEIGARMFTIHASAGINAMRAAVANKGDALVLAVTVLTSLDKNVEKLEWSTSIEQKVLQLAHDAKSAGCDGIVSSPLELPTVSREGEGLTDMVKVAVGIRSKDDPVEGDDQKRTMSAGDAIKAGADYLVIGRPIINSPDPVRAAMRFGYEIKQGLLARR